MTGLFIRILGLSPMTKNRQAAHAIRWHGRQMAAGVRGAHSVIDRGDTTCSRSGIHTIHPDSLSANIECAGGAIGGVSPHGSVQPSRRDRALGGRQCREQPRVRALGC